MGPDTVPTKKSAMVKFMIRYVVRLRKWRFLAKVRIVKPFIMDVTAYSTIKTVSHVDLNIREKESVSVSLGVLEFQHVFRVL